MANFSTWSGNFDGAAAGTNGKDTELTLSSGKVLTSADQITNITFTLRITCSRYSSSKTWDLHWFALDSSTGSPYADPISVAMSSTDYTFSGTMHFDSSDSWKFFYDTINVYAKANTTHSYTSYMREVTITVEYETASLTAPTDLSIFQPDNGQFFIIWEPAVGTNGSGDITYTVFNADNEPIADVGTNNYYLANVPGYDFKYTYSVAAYYSGISKRSSSVSFTFSPPIITVSDLTLTSAQGDSAVLTWSKPEISYGTASSYDYIIQYSTPWAIDIEYITLSNRTDEQITYTIPSNWFEREVEDGEIVQFSILVKAHINSYVADSYYNTIQDTTNYVIFTYDGKYTVGYYNGDTQQWEECTLHYYDGSTWIECIPYYYNGSTWIPIKTKT